MRNDVITIINNVFDEVTELRVRNLYLETQVKEKDKSNMCEVREISELDKKIIEYGIRQLAKYVLYSWDTVTAVRNEETNEIEYTEYKNWIEDKINKNNIPDNMSKGEIINVLNNYANELYLKEINKAKAKLLDMESKNE